MRWTRTVVVEFREVVVVLLLRTLVVRKMVREEDGSVAVQCYRLDHRYELLVVVRGWA